jgi:hypothetical protein
MVYWSKKSWAVILLITVATIFTGANPAVLRRAVGQSLGNLIAAIIDYLKTENAYVCVPVGV